MKWYSKLLIALSLIAAAVFSGFASFRILQRDFEPLTIAVGTENYAIAEKEGDSFRITVLDEKGDYLYDEKQTLSLPAERSSLSAMHYDNGVYYLWETGTETTGEASVYVHAASGEEGAQSRAVHLEQGSSTLIGMQMQGGTLCAILSEVMDKGIILSVHLAGVDSAVFTPAESYQVSGFYSVRSAVYCDNGSVMFLTGDGSVHEVVPGSSAPVLRYDGTDEPAAKLYMNGQQEVCLLDCDGKILRLNSDMQTEIYLTAMLSHIQHNHPEMDMKYCTDLSVADDSHAAMLFTDETGVLYSALYQNGMLQIVSSVERYSWLVYAAVFLAGFCIITLLEYLAAGCTLYFTNETVSLKKRICVVFVLLAAVILTIVTVLVYQFYHTQKTEQRWERLTITLNNTVLYLNTEEHASLEWMKASEKETFSDAQWLFVRKIRSLPQDENMPSCILFAGDQSRLTAVSGTAQQIGLTPEQLYLPEDAARIYAALEKGSGQNISWQFRQNGKDWMAMGTAIYTGDVPAGVIVMQMSMEEQTDYQILFVTGLLYLAVAVFFLLMLARIHFVLRPLHHMEQRAEEFTVKGNCLPLPVKGHNEIAMLTLRFNHAIRELRESMQQSERNAKAYSRFVSKDLIALMSREKLSEVHVQDKVQRFLTILYLRIRPADEACTLEESMQQYDALYAHILPMIQKNGGIPERISLREMRVLFSESSLNAVCAASVIREYTEGSFLIDAVIDCGMTSLTVYGAEHHVNICTCMQREQARIPLMRRVLEEFGCRILITGEVAQAISDFSLVFNSRTIGFFEEEDESPQPIHMIEILPQRCSDLFETAARLYRSGNYTEAFILFSEVVEKNKNDAAAVRYLYLCNQAFHQNREEAETV